MPARNSHSHSQGRARGVRGWGGEGAGKDSQITEMKGELGPDSNEPRDSERAAVRYSDAALSFRGPLVWVSEEDLIGG